MHLHPIHSHEICRARQQEREAEARMYRFQRGIRGRSKALTLVSNFCHTIGGVPTAITQASTGLPRLAGNDDAEQPKAA